MANRRYCNYCLGAARPSPREPKHPVLPYDAPTPAHVHAFKHHGGSCPHLKLHKEIWRLSSHRFYQQYTNLLKEAGFGPGALLKVSHRLPSSIYKPWDRMAVVTHVNFESDGLYGLESGYNYLLGVDAEVGDFLFNWPHGMSLYLYDVLSNNPVIDHERDLEPQIKALAKEKLTALEFNSRTTKGKFSFDCWNDPSTWFINYDLLRKSTFEVKVLQPATLHVPPPIEDLNYSEVVRIIRKQGSYSSKDVRFYHD